MEVSVKNRGTGFDVTFHIRTEEDVSSFHDLVAIKITNEPHEFIGDVYTRLYVIRPRADITYDLPMSR